MAERCPDCGLLLQLPGTAADDDHCGRQLPQRKPWFAVNACRGRTNTLLRAKLTKLEAERDAMAKVIEAAVVMGEALELTGYDNERRPMIDPFYEAKAELEKLRSQGEEA